MGARRMKGKERRNTVQNEVLRVFDRDPTVPLSYVVVLPNIRFQIAWKFRDSSIKFGFHFIFLKMFGLPRM